MIEKLCSNLLVYWFVILGPLIRKAAIEIVRERLQTDVYRVGLTAD